MQINPITPPRGLYDDPRSASLGQGWYLKARSEDENVDLDLTTFRDRLALEVASREPWYSALCAFNWNPVVEDGREYFVVEHAPAASVDALREYNKVQDAAQGVSFRYVVARDTSEPRNLSAEEVARAVDEVARRYKGIEDRSFQGVPTYFRARCMTARRGGAGSYSDAGWHLAIHLHEHQPYAMERDEWSEAINELTDLLADALSEGSTPDEVTETESTMLAWEWVARHMPRCAALVPKKRRMKFVGGVLQAFEDGRV